MRVGLVTLPLVGALVAVTACTRRPEEAATTTSAAREACALPPGKYGVQSVTHHSGEGVYKLYLLDTPACVAQPVALERVRLSRLATEPGKKEARLEMATNEDPVLQLTEDFKIDLVNAVVENGQVVREESSSWLPFVAGAAGAAVAGMALSSMFNRPQYYMPPPHKPGMAEVRGYGGAGSSYQGAVNNYQSTYKAPPPAAQSNGFFRRGANSTAPGGAPGANTGPGRLGAREEPGRPSQVQPRNDGGSSYSRPTAPRKPGFFRRRGR